MNTIIQVIKAMRPTQWTKNGVVLAALVFAIGDRSQPLDIQTAVIQAILAAFLFCLISGSVYLMNDVKDARQDRLHPVKKNRPVASGKLSPSAAKFSAVLIAVLGLLVAFQFSVQLGAVLLAYLIMQVCYTTFLKKIALVDVFIIAGGFVLRALAGAVAINVLISPWLLLCTLLLALFLALCKRRQEFVSTQAESKEASTRDSLHAYDEKLLDQLISMTGSATLLSYSLYTLWPDTTEKFQTHGMAFTIPFVAFGLFRYMDLVYRHDRGERPEQLLLTDKPLLVTIFLYGLTVLGVIFIS